MIKSRLVLTSRLLTVWPSADNFHQAPNFTRNIFHANGVQAIDENLTELSRLTLKAFDLNSIFQKTWNEKICWHFCRICDVFLVKIWNNNLLQQINPEIVLFLLVAHQQIFSFQIKSSDHSNPSPDLYFPIFFCVRHKKHSFPFQIVKNSFLATYILKFMPYIIITHFM